MRFTYFTCLVLLLVLSTALSLTPNKVKNVVVQKVSTFNGQKSLSPIPKLKEVSSYPVVSAQSVFAVDLDSGVVLYEKNPDALLLPASTTKIVTALTAMDHFKMDDILVVGDINVDGRKMGLVKDESLTFEDLLYGLLVLSANDAAEVIAANYPGGRQSFVMAMNLKAKQLNLEKTSFNNPAGFDAKEQLTTARDLIRAAEVAMQNKDFAKIVGTEQKLVRSQDGTKTHLLHTTNELLGSTEGVLGVKTGWTENARENLVTYVDRDGRKVMVALLASQDRFGETKEIVEWIYDSYNWESVNYLTNN